MFLSEPSLWAQSIFQRAQLGDVRRTKRLVQLAAQLAAHTGQSIVQSLSSSADIEAAYRFVRNDTISPAAIAEAGFAVTVQACEPFACLLALEDTTSLEFTHSSVVEELGHTTSHKHSSELEAHTVLLFALKAQQVVGLIEQHRRWSLLAPADH